MIGIATNKANPTKPFLGPHFNDPDKSPLSLTSEKPILAIQFITVFMFWFVYR